MSVHLYATQALAPHALSCSFDHADAVPQPKTSSVPASNPAQTPRFYATDRVLPFVLVVDINATVFVARLLHLLGLPREKARSAQRGLALGTALGLMRLVCMSVIWLAERYLDVGSIVVKRGIIEVFVHLAYRVPSRRLVPSPIDLFETY
jgi:hypothetical protein